MEKRQETRQFRDAIAIQTRKTLSAEGLWHGNFKAGRNAYYLAKRPIIVLLGSVYKMVVFPFYPVLAYLMGYLISVLRRGVRIQDE